VGWPEGRRDEARSSALKAEVVAEPNARPADSLWLWEELSFLAFSFRGGVRLCFPCGVACHRFATGAMRFRGTYGAGILKFGLGIGCALQC
jgi:hypothetical protein